MKNTQKPISIIGKLQIEVLTKTFLKQFERKCWVALCQLTQNIQFYWGKAVITLNKQITVEARLVRSCPNKSHSNMGAGTVMICLKPWGHFEFSRNEITAAVFVFNLESCSTESTSPNLWDFILIKPALPQTMMLEASFNAGYSFGSLQGLCSDHKPPHTYAHTFKKYKLKKS